MTGWSKNQPLDALMEAKLEGYDIAVRQVREGKRIAPPLDTDQRIALMLVAYAAIAAVALVASWVLP